MKRKLLFIVMLLVMAFTLIGCNSAKYTVEVYMTLMRQFYLKEQLS